MTEENYETRQSWMVLGAVSVAWSFALLTVAISLLPAITTFIEHDTGWSRTQVSGAMGALVVSAALISPWVGAKMDQIGAHKVIIAGQSITIAALLALAIAGNQIIVYYAAFALAGLAAAALTPTTYMRVISQWFDKRRGIAMGLAAFGGSLLAIALPLAGVAISQEYGWQANFMALAIVSLAIALPAQIFFIKDRDTQRLAARPHSDGLIKTMRNLWSEKPLIQSLIANFFLVGLGQVTILFAIPPMLTDRGMSPEAAAGAQAVAGIATLFGKLAGGFLFDYFRSAKPIIIGLSFSIVGIMGFAAGAVGPFAYICAFLVGLSAGIENDAPPYLVSRYFGIEHFGKIAATITTISILALAIGPVGGAGLKELTGHYTATCLAAIGVLVWAIWLTLKLPAFPRPHETLDPEKMIDEL